MPCTVKEVLDLARGELGIKENPPYSNKVKYNTEYYGREISGSAYPWCMAFVWWLFKHAGAPELFYDGKKTASCTTLMNWAKKSGRFVTSGYKPGDVILFQFNNDSYSEHTGICESVSGSYVTCIEGNTGANSDADGGEVQRRKRSTSLVMGAYRPSYKDAADVPINNDIKEETCEVILRVLKNGTGSYGSSGNDVKSLQILLNGLGYNCGSADGKFGAKTESAVKKFQANKKIDVDGCCGPQTWGKLLQE